MGGLIISKGANVAGDLYNQALSTAYFPGRRIYSPSYAELSDVEIVDKLKRDPIISQLITFRKHLVAGRSWNVEPMRQTVEDKEIAVITEQALKNIERFESSKFNLSEATFRGSAYAYIEGKRINIKLGNDTVERSWWIPTRLRDVGLERFGQVVKDDGNVIWEFWSIKEMAWKELTHPEWFIRHKYEDTERTLGYGRGLIEAMYIYAYSKSVVLELGLQGIDRWALGMLIAKIDTSLVTEPNITTKTILENTVNALKKMRTNHVLALDKNDDVVNVTGGSEGYGMVKDMLSYLDNALRILVLSANLPTSATGGGSYSLGEIQENSTEALIQYDRTLLAETLTRDLIGLFYGLNESNFKAMKLEKANKPVFSIVQEKRVDPVATMNVISQALNAGIRLREDEVYEKIGFSIPQANDKIVIPNRLPTVPNEETPTT